MHEKQVLSWFIKRLNSIQSDKTLQCSVNNCLVHLSSAVLMSYTMNFIQGHFLNVWTCRANVVGVKNSPLKTDLIPLCTEINTWPAKYARCCHRWAARLHGIQITTCSYETWQWLSSLGPRTEYDLKKNKKNKRDIKLYPNLFIPSCWHISYWNRKFVAIYVYFILLFPIN